MNRWLSIIGAGDDGLGGLAPAARALLERAEIVVGSKRLLERDGAALSGKDLVPWASPLGQTLDRIGAWRGREVAVLASGDPMYFGIGCTLARRFPAEEMTIVPAPSAFSLAAARLAWPLQDVEQISLHGRAAQLLIPFIAPRVRILALTSGAATVAEAAGLLAARGFGASVLTVLEHMGGEAERLVTLRADEVGRQDFAELNLLAVECVCGPGARILSRLPGLPDAAFAHDGQLTKAEVRAVTLSALAPTPGALLWDVGAGCGSISVEWMRAARGCRAIAFEREEARREMIAANALALGVPGLEIVSGDAPQSLVGAPVPDAVFIGGAVADEEIFAACWRALHAGGRLVANAVTLEGEAALLARHARHGGELVRIDI
ncbi:MAG TPA: precorrin-6y C5,15-methyltransferase (decarboxylating) subunit CbiE, partial [Hyphomicrobiales bacterium]|nr:precorrin-6y C5,15-methyltransferase (decarboxylating) subunit CbiE [Hyphomicrobiales bacterium]